MRIKRSDTIYDICHALAKPIMHSYHKVQYEGAQHIPEQGPALVIAKHQSLQDIILEGIFLRTYCQRQGNWVMKSRLPGILKYLGGIKVKRPRDLPKDRKQRKKQIQGAKDQNKEANQYIEWLLQQGEIIVAHPEATRSPYRMAPFRKEIFTLAKRVQREHGIEIPVIPLGIEYDPSIWAPRSRVCVRAGKPSKAVTPGLADKVSKELYSLSNLQYYMWK